MKMTLNPSVERRGKNANPGMGITLCNFMQVYKQMIITNIAVATKVGMNTV